MANELSLVYPGANAVYVIIRQTSDGFVWNGTAWVSWVDANIATYDIPLVGLGGDFYAADAPTALVNGTEYRFLYYERAGAMPVITDLLLASEEGMWNGTTVTPSVGIFITTIAELRIALGETAASISSGDANLLAQVQPAAESAVRRFLGYNPARATHTELYPRHVQPPGSGRGGVWDLTPGGLVQFGSFGSHGDERLQLKHLPVRTITTIHEDTDARAGSVAGSFAAATLLTEGDDYYLDTDEAGTSRSGIVYRVGSWPLTPMTVQVVYVAGFTAAEFAGTDDSVDAQVIKATIILEAVRRFNTLKALGTKTGAGYTGGPLSGEKLGDYSYSVDTATAKALTGMQWGLSLQSQQDLESFRHYGEMVL